MSEIIEINRIEDLSQYRLLWKSLLGQTRGGSFFQSLEWLETYWEHFGLGQNLRVLIVYAADVPIGIVPLTVVRERTKVGSVRVLTYPLHDWGWFYGPIGPNPAATLTAAMHYIRQTPRDWDMLDLRWTNTDAHDHGRTERAMKAAGFQGNKGVWKETALVDLSGGWEEYWKGRTSKFRNNLRRQERRFDNLGDVAYVRHRPLGSAHGDDDPRWDLLDDCIELAGRTWQGASKTGTTLSHQSVRDFFRKTHALAVKAGALDLNVLTRGGRPVAFGYNYHSNGYVFGLRIGHDPEYKKVGLGNLLYLNTFRDGCERGDHTFDMGPGSIQIKQAWLTKVARCYRYTHYPLSVPRVQLMRVKRWLTSRHQSETHASAGKQSV